MADNKYFSFFNMDFTTNYCGVYWSDGKIQSSVAEGSSEPVSPLDFLCMEHDAAYNKSLSVYDKIAADNKFYSASKHLGARGRLYGSLVKYGNSFYRDTGMAFLLPFGALLGTSLATTSVLAGMLPGNASNATDTSVASSPVMSVVYDPRASDPPSGGGFCVAVNRPSKAKSTAVEIGEPSAVPGSVMDPSVMVPLGKRKKKRRTTKRKRALPNPPKNKNNKKRNG